MENYIVYLHISPSGKGYVGITGRSVTCRWGKSGNGYKSEPKFYNAIQKYGWDSFKHVIMSSGLSKEKAMRLESHLVKALGTYENGYNATPDGDGAIGKKQNFDDTRRRNKERSKRVYQFTLDGTLISSFESAREAEAKTGCSYKHISSCCLNKRKTCGGFLWSFKNNGPGVCVPKSVRHTSQGVLQIDQVTKRIISKHKSITEASISTGIGKPQISRACNSDTGYCCGFLWRYDADDNVSFSDLRRSKRILCIENGRAYESGAQAGRELNINPNSIYESIRRGADATAGGFHWKYLC